VVDVCVQKYALGGAGAIVMEATAVVPEGRISPEDAVCCVSYHHALVYELTCKFSGALDRLPNCPFEACG
jgi:hypothetical protein